MDTLAELKANQDLKYKEFNTKIVATKQEVIGVRMPILRKLAKRIARENPLEFINSDKKNVFEMVMLEGLVLSYMNESFIKLLPQTEKFIAKVDSWAQIDTTISGYKNIRDEIKEIVPVIKRWLESDQEFMVRSGLIMLLAHYITDEYLEMVFELSNKVSHPGYYVSMGNAWLIATCMAKYPVETTEFYKNNNLDKVTHNRAIQKARESFRVSKEDKELLKTLKRR